MLIAVTAGVGIVAAANGQAGNPGFFGSMHRWANNMMQNGNGNWSGYGGCPFFGTSSNYANGTNPAGPEVSTIEEAISIAEAETEQEISEDNVFQMGRWWVFSYVDEEGTIKQGRIDAFTGDVIEDFTANQNQGQYRQNGHGMMRGGSGYYGGCYNT